VGDNVRKPIVIVSALVALAIAGCGTTQTVSAPQKPVRVQIPYSPTFLTEVRQGNVHEITSTSGTIQGTFKHAVKYPPNDATAQPTIDFSTQVPSFANNTELSNLLQRHGVTIAPAR
jgi:hypothetical protein